jgi:hypothetical protein
VVGLCVAAFSSAYILDERRDQLNPQSGQRRLDLLRSLHIAYKDFEGA